MHSLPRPKTYLFAGGGSGGHLFPGLAVAEELRDRDASLRIVFIGSGRPIETEILAATKYEHITLPVEPSTTFRRRPLRFLRKTWTAYRQAVRILCDLRPVAVIGLGGFASVPVVYAAQRRKIATVLLEQNTIPGRATRWLSRRSDAVCLTFTESAASLPPKSRTIVTGNPVRRRIVALSDYRSVEGESQPLLLILGGSQGSAAVNEAAITAAEALREELSGWRIAHQTGPRDEAAICQRYERLGVKATVAAFLSDLSPWYAQATIAVSRAGATTLAELACAGCPTILIPYPEAMDDHQRHNARVFADAGAARIVEQSPQTGHMAAGLARELAHLFDAETRATMARAMRSLAKPYAARSVADQIGRLIRPE